MHTERACVAKPYSLQVRIFTEKDKCIEGLLRKTAKQVINDYAGRCIVQCRLREGKGRCQSQLAGVCCQLL